jgi:hypothetical protein
MQDAHRILIEHFGSPADSDFADLLWEHGAPIQAILHFPVFFPVFAEVDGHVVLKSYLDEEGGPDRLRDLLRSAERSPTEVLAGYPWREVPSQFRDLADVSEAVLVALAELMACSWQAALSQQFPDRTWSTAVLPAEATGGELAVSFTQAV